MRVVAPRLAIALLAASVSSVAWTVEIRLEGVNILGSSRSAYLSVDGKRGRFSEGDTMEGWTLERIAPRSVDLRTPEGELRTVTLHGSTGQKSADSEDARGKGAGVNFSPRVIDDRDVPPGYRKVRTPFGDVLVDESKQGNSLIMEQR